MSINRAFTGMNFDPTGGGAAQITVTPATAANVAGTLTRTSTSGSTTAGVYQVSIANIGGAAGTVAGVTINPGDPAVVFTAYFDAATNTMNRIAAIAYDATGTTFLISETA